MGLIEKIKLLFKARQPVTDIINEVKDAKAGWKTIPFWVTLLGSAVALVGALQGVIPVSTALIIGTVLTTLYNILRGATKASDPGTKPIFQTTEFWLGVLQQVSMAILTLEKGGINPTWFATASTVMGVAMAAGQNLASQQPNAPPLPPAPK